MELIQNGQTQVYCWGLGKEGILTNKYNLITIKIFKGQIGNNQFENQNLPQKVLINIKQQDNIVQVQAGGQYSAILTKDGNVYMFGSNKKGKMGIKDEEKDYSLPQQIKELCQIKKIALGDWHSLALDNNGQCFSVGYSKFGALGIDNQQSSNLFLPIYLKNNERIQQIYAGRNISLFINENNQLYSSGIGFLTGNNKVQYTPQVVQKLENVKINISSAGFTSCAAIDNKGQIYTWGKGVDYNLGHGNCKDVAEPKLIEKLIQTKDIISQSQNIIFTKVSCSRGDKNVHMGAVTQNGDVYTWGSGYKGKLGHVKSENNKNDGFQDYKIPKKIENFDEKAADFIAGGIHSAILTQKNELFTFGCGSDGRLGHPEKGNHRYLYKEEYPKKIEYFKQRKVLQAFSSYYHMICMVE
ncbi:Regulator of chromosome condensation 1/beta-lactamase-inhibitor protein II [Pseudocohnilembus persalinus]|uniref:Regulator of chromosome condensation 1/beta-lactamase-inhibitor protein II n=1 Tax=Pseudocohnilembus persalinus TaxID=266149 RepID=A0A0V0QV77_PSEPJ|nr:Regulator of chromosome condensation 1/beta-lactamase-inhibitor protein II [Pseudocohnilembus persalinus]|eukprot:KRX05946.1 Regulator of chromosome condensation 1/beta-lactamase-inhibitor protein II [Pseudocohnilembus persalinus]